MYALIDVPPSSGAFQETSTFLPIDVVRGATGVPGICAARIAISSEKAE
jgi:hypothetical protein